MPSSGSTRHHSTPKRYTPRPSEASSATSSGYRCTWSIAAPLGSATPVPTRVSHPHQSAFVLSPSTWCAPVAAPHRNPSGNRRVVTTAYTHLRAHETVLDLVCRLLLEKKKKKPKT